MTKEFKKILQLRRDLLDVGISLSQYTAYVGPLFDPEPQTETKTE